MKELRIQILLQNFQNQDEYSKNMAQGLLNGGLKKFKPEGDVVAVDR
ncbi:hypothetical protein [Bacillus thuringiensis]|nr:hypothetical protein [Bacillus thuringiensis]